MAPIVPSLKVIKSFPFKGGTRQWSNRYCLTGTAPSDDTHWHTLMDNVVNAEKAVLRLDVTIIECLGYAAGSDVAVSQKTYSTAGTVSPASGFLQQAGEVVALVRWSTAARSVKNHPIYLFKYYHGAYTGSGGPSYDILDENQESALATYAGSWVSGFSDGTVTHKLTSPQGHDATGAVVEEYVTHRDFPSTTSL